MKKLKTSKSARVKRIRKVLAKIAARSKKVLSLSKINADKESTKDALAAAQNISRHLNSKEPIAYKRYSPEAQLIKQTQAMEKRIARRIKRGMVIPASGGVL